MTTSDFEWPCDRRYAHGSHPVDQEKPDGSVHSAICPGVQAHPATMCGGSYPADEKGNLTGQPS